MKISWIKNLMIVFLGLAFLASCEYEYITVDPPAPPDPGDTTKISFKDEIEPIFMSSSCTNCHTSSMDLDLTTGNSYNSIYDNGAVTPGDPNTSEIYTLPHPTTGTHSTKYSTIEEANQIYLWIQQGALDN